ncbi:hypothetical protein QFC19_006688 [Naganishia cerealis]|uniref:Uncharacterized protein n=1 Tax=Naganishia cerealis TaxID=610337 RepID=A0ACC2VFD8_9TREE|nr:hypothetical protein QFC19_006688 [Naganishia cerealis]
MFLYYRRRRLRYYQGEEWPFPTLPANGRTGRRRKEEKDFGETPEMFEYLLDVPSSTGASGSAIPPEPSQNVWGGTQDITERSLTMPTITIPEDDISQWQPVTVKSLHTRSMPESTPLAGQAVNNNSATGSSQPARTSTLFSRTLSTSRNMFALGGVTLANNSNSNSNNNSSAAIAEQGHATFTPSSSSTLVPLSVTLIIAMPSALRDTSAANHRTRQSTDLGLLDEENQEEIPEVELGMTSVNLAVPGVSRVPSPTASGYGLSAAADTLEVANDASRTNIFKKPESRQNQTVAGGPPIGNEQRNARSSAIGADGTLDLLALLNQ